MVMSMKVNGKMIKPMVSGFISTPMDLHIQVNGLKIFNKVMESNNGQMGLIMKENIIWVINKVEESLFGLINPFMKVSSIRIKFKEMEKWYGLMEKNMKDLGKIIKCMVNKVLLNGQMEEFILETILKTKKTWPWKSYLAQWKIV